MTNPEKNTPTRLSKTKIVIVEDDEIYGKVLSYQLRAKGFNIFLSKSGKELFNLIREHGIPDLFILDYFLGDAEPSGLDLCRKIKSYTDSPVIMLTGNTNVETLVSCLNEGAEQYIVKPCDIRELIARIEVTLRNKGLSTPEPPKTFVLKVDEEVTLSGEESALFHTDGRIVQLTQKESALMELFLLEDNRFISRQSAYQSLYGFDMDPMNRSIDVLVSRLRKKIRQLNDDFRIKNLRGHGYVLYKLGQHYNL